MNKVVNNNTVVPTKIVVNDWFAMPIIEDYMSLKVNKGVDVLLIVGDGSNVLGDIES